LKALFWLHFQERYNSQGIHRGINNMASPAFLFDLDGTLVDSVYQHVLAWKEAFEAIDMRLSIWRLHRRIGMSGGLFVNALCQEIGRPITEKDMETVSKKHQEVYGRLRANVRVLPGAKELLKHLTENNVAWAIATSGYISTAKPLLDLLEVPEGIPVVTRDQVERAKPDPDLFIAAAQRLKVDIEHSVVVGDSIWDLLAARRARALSIGFLSGGYGREELQAAGAYRVYEDPAELLSHLYEVGVRASLSVK
jgi:HAD superfamily hydrolase (TIGR01549 family)